jgi:hypothetical protein
MSFKDTLHPALHAFLEQEVPAYQAEHGSLFTTPPSAETFAKVEAMIAEVTPDITKVDVEDLTGFMRSRNNMHPVVADYIDANAQTVQSDIDSKTVSPAAFQRAAMYLHFAGKKEGLISALNQDVILQAFIKHHAEGLKNLL